MIGTTLEKARPVLFGLGGTGVAVVYLLSTFSGYYFYDDYTYAKYAYQLLHGQFIVQPDSFSHRVGFIGLLAGVYALGGINDFTHVFWPVSLTLGTSACLYTYLRKQPAVCFYAVTATSLQSYYLFFIDKIYPDTALTFFTLLAAIIAQQCRHRYPRAAALAVAVLFMVALLVKETALLSFLPFVLIGTVEYVRDREGAGRFAWTAFLSGAFLLILYFGAYHWLRGNALLRFSNIVDANYVHAQSYSDKPLSVMIARLTYAPWLMFAESGFLVIVLPGLWVALRRILTRKPDWRSPEFFWSVFALVMLPAFWFVSTDTRHYNPLSLLPRLYFPLIPPFAILTAYAWARAEASDRIKLVLTVLYGAAAVVSLAIGSKYLPVYLLLAALPWVAKAYDSLRKHAAPVSGTLRLRTGLVLTLVIVPGYRMIHPQQWGYQAEKAIFNTYLTQQKGKYLVITDSRLAERADWYYAFEAPANYTFKALRAADSVKPALYHKVYVLHNPHTYRETGEPTEQWEHYQAAHQGRLKLVFQRNKVILYELKK